MAENQTTAKKRIFVDQLPKSITKEDIIQLFSKLVPIQEIYRPGPTITGTSRDFAIVIFLGDDELLRKCNGLYYWRLVSTGVRTFNGCHWKGSKIRVNLANEYYLDKLNREKAETVPQQPISVPSITTFAEGSILKIKRRKNEHVYVGTGDMQQNSQDILKTGKRRKFTDEGNYFEESSDRVENHSTEPTLLLPIEAESANASPSKSKEDIESNPPPRKGQRIGFGALASLPPRTVNETKRENFQTFAPPCTTCAENLIENQEFDSLDSLKTEHQSSRDNSSGIVITESGLYDDLSDSDDENCISQEELLEESLLVERERQKRIFSLLHESISASVPSAVNFDQTTDPHEIEAVPIIEPLRKNPFRNSTWSQTILRFDPLRHKQSQQYLLSPEEVQERDKSLARTHNPLDTEGTADLEKLKGIFHRDGGLGWDSSGKGVIQRDPEINERIDNLILEAERFGFDVRGESDTNNQEKENGSSMVFGFFDGPQEDSDSEHHGDESSDDAQSSDDNSEIFTHEEENESSKYHNDEEHIFHYPSYEEVLAIASRFKRDLSESKLIENWKKTREKLVLDYKRKAKEAKKRNLHYPPSMGSSVGKKKEQTISDSKQRKRKITNKRGGVKHRKK